MLDGRHYHRATQNAGIDIKRNGGWHRCIAAYTLLPKINELVEFENQYAITDEQNTTDEESLREQLFEIVNSAVSTTINFIRSEFE